MVTLETEILPFPESAIVAIFSISRDFWINSVNSVFFQLYVITDVTTLLAYFGLNNDWTDISLNVQEPTNPPVAFSDFVFLSRPVFSTP